MTDNYGLVKDRIDLAAYIGQYAPLKRSGSGMTCCCPLPGHDDKHPSFSVKGDRWECFGKCAAYGDVFDFAERYHGLSKADALVELARYAGVELEALSPEHKVKQDQRERLYALMEDSAKLFEEWLWGPVGENALRYLREGRGLSDETIKAARMGLSDVQGGNALCSGNLIHMGYSDEEQIAAGMAKRSVDGRMYDTFRNRIVVPIRDHKGRIVAFSGRAMGKDQTPKYLHNATNEIFEKSKLVHKMPVNQSTKATGNFPVTVVVEGSLDPISGANRGIYNIVSLLGKSITPDQFALLCTYGTERLVFCLDRDDAGRAALKALVSKHAASAADKGIELLAMFAPHGKDPDDTFREKPELWQGAVDAARPVVDVLIDLELSQLGAHRTATKVSAKINELLPILRSNNPLIENENIQTLANATGVTFDRLKNWLDPQLHILPKPAAPNVTASDGLPSLEEWVIHALLVNDDHQWLERANAALDTLTIETMPYALAPLSINDFMQKDTRLVMNQIVIAANSDGRPLYAALDYTFTGTNNQTLYERLRHTEDRSLILGGPAAMDYDEFIGAVFELRANRLASELSRVESGLTRECATAIALLRLSREESAL